MYNSYTVLTGYIVKVNKEKRTVQVQTSESTEPFNIRLYQLIGSAFIPLIKESSLCYVFKIKNKKSNAFCLPFDVLQQEANLPFGEEGDLVQGNPYSGCKITYKVNGDIVVEAEGENQNIIVNGKTITINGENEININTDAFNVNSQITNINSDNVNIGDASALALNANAQILDSMGAPCTIAQAGQIKVKI